MILSTSHLIIDKNDLWLCLRRYVYHTLKNSVNTVPTISQADAVYVYDYCYVMWALGDHHAAGHWWLRDNYIPDRRAGQYLLSAYRCARLCPASRPISAEPSRQHCSTFSDDGKILRCARAIWEGCAMLARHVLGS